MTRLIIRGCVCSLSSSSQAQEARSIFLPSSGGSWALILLEEGKTFLGYHLVQPAVCSNLVDLLWIPGSWWNSWCWAGSWLAPAVPKLALLTFEDTEALRFEWKGKCFVRVKLGPEEDWHDSHFFDPLFIRLTVHCSIMTVSWTFGLLLLSWSSMLILQVREHAVPTKSLRFCSQVASPN